MKDENILSLMFGLNLGGEVGNIVSLSLSSSAHKITYKNVLGQQGSVFCMGYSPHYNVRT